MESYWFSTEFSKSQGRVVKFFLKLNAPQGLLLKHLGSHFLPCPHFSFIEGPAVCQDK